MCSCSPLLFVSCVLVVTVLSSCATKQSRDDSERWTGCQPISCLSDRPDMKRGCLCCHLSHRDELGLRSAELNEDLFLLGELVSEPMFTHRKKAAKMKDPAGWSYNKMLQLCETIRDLESLQNVCGRLTEDVETHPALQASNDCCQIRGKQLPASLKEVRNPRASCDELYVPTESSSVVNVCRGIQQMSTSFKSNFSLETNQRRPRDLECSSKKKGCNCSWESWAVSSTSFKGVSSGNQTFVCVPRRRGGWICQQIDAVVSRGRGVASVDSMTADTRRSIAVGCKEEEEEEEKRAEEIQEEVRGSCSCSVKEASAGQFREEEANKNQHARARRKLRTGISQRKWEKECNAPRLVFESVPRTNGQPGNDALEADNCSKEHSKEQRVNAGNVRRLPKSLEAPPAAAVSTARFRLRSHSLLSICSLDDERRQEWSLSLRQEAEETSLEEVEKNLDGIISRLRTQRNQRTIRRKRSAQQDVIYLDLPGENR
ncbi:unnamed protein product, partial [Cyprideis torosa]